MGAILVIDDEPGIRATVKDILEDEGYATLTAEDGPIGLETLRRESVDVVILDVWLPRMGGIDVLKAIRADHPAIETIVVSGHASIDMAVNAVKLGAFDFIEKPLSIERLITAVRNARALCELKLENSRLKLKTIENDDMIGSSIKMAEVRELIDQSARSDARVLITGENGTGKELAARRIHELSARASGPFVAVNCAAMPDTLIESELFGHEKGSFTDAVARRKGKFETAHTGTLFLDEIGDMSLSAQSKMLRAIQEMRFERLGGEQTIEVDVRVVAATNKDLRQEIAAGRFREDLFFRLNVIPLRMPALRERPEDIPALAAFFLERLGGGSSRRLSEGAIAALSSYDWPGNIRELKNFMERVSVMSDEDSISAETIAHFIGRSDGKDEESIPDRLDTLSELRLSEAREAFERGYLLHNLRKNGYNIAKTAETIGVYPSNLHAKIKKFGIEAGE
ncbi:MAG: Fis family transcriptional regulator [Spirochaetae bacterium HGW-Spirochaetae-3]|jgi:two-component system nitrogen regulation response regulator NtrX|nr:MAG: Fis family transcriptional regulator [Spirochaetae bacterium HGW-Spirochaetae-3]